MIWVRVIRGLVHAWAAGVEQVLQVAAQEIPVEVVGLPAILTVDHEPTDSLGPEKDLVDLEFGEIGQEILTLLRGELAVTITVQIFKISGGVGGITLERVNRLVVHPFTLVPKWLAVRVT